MFKHSKTIAWLSGLTTIAIAGLSFALSFNALKHLAHQHGVSIPWAFPILLEGSVIVFSLSALLRSKEGRQAAILQHFTANPTMAIKDLAEVLNVSRPTIYSTQGSG